MILMLSGIWLDDQGQFDKAVLKYRQAANRPKETVSDLRRCGVSDGFSIAKVSISRP